MIWVEKSEFMEKDLQKINRYYVSKRGAKIIKCSTVSNKRIQAEAGKTLVTLFNEYENKPWNDYGIDNKYYMDSAYKEIQNIAGAKKQQLSLF